MHTDLDETFAQVKSLFEIEDSENGLVKRIQNSSIELAYQDTLLVLFDQAQRSFNEQQPVSFRGRDDDHTKRLTPHSNLLYQNPLFLEYALLSMGGLINGAEYREQITEKLESFYFGIHEHTKLYLPKDLANADHNQDITYFLHDFYEWHTRPTIIAARHTLFDQRSGGEVNSDFEKYIDYLKPQMHDIHGSLIKSSLDEVYTHSGQILTNLTPVHIDQLFAEPSSERKFMVGLYAAAHFFNYATSDRPENKQISKTMAKGEVGNPLGILTTEKK